MQKGQDPDITFCKNRTWLEPSLILGAHFCFKDDKENSPGDHHGTLDSRGSAIHWLCDLGKGTSLFILFICKVWVLTCTCNVF